jgi:hypothetical protein
MKKILVFLMFALAFTACTDDFEDDLRDPKKPLEVPARLLFSNAQRNLVDQITTPSVNSGIFRLLAQQWASTTYPEESRYDLVTRNIPQNFWSTLYRDVLMDLRESSKIVAADPFITPAQKANQLAMIEVMEVYTWSILVNTFGDIPYTEALTADIIYPKYDDAAAIYTDLFKRLDAAIESLNANSTSNVGDFASADLVYSGSVSKWILFANSLKLKLAMTVSDVDPATAKAKVEQAAPNVFQSAADNAVFKYTSTTPNVNPIWSNLVQSGRNDFVPANTLVDLMNEYKDPRRVKYFEPLLDDKKKPILDSSGKVQYVGGIYGDNNIYLNFSHVNPDITVPNFPALLMSYSEVQFYLAEAAARGYTTPSTAVEHFEKAIKASLEYWGVGDQASQYLAEPEVSAQVATMASGTDGTLSEAERRAIGIQKWISLYNRGLEAWTEFRRLDYPQLLAPVDQDARYNIVPVRYPYPPTEGQLNKENLEAAVAKMGGDDATKKIFWDVR